METNPYELVYEQALNKCFQFTPALFYNQIDDLIQRSGCSRFNSGYR
jgi:hypothetical protein